MDSGQSQLILMKNPSVGLTEEKICVDLEKYVTNNTNSKVNWVSERVELHFNTQLVTKCIVRSCFLNDLNSWPLRFKDYRVA